jgi:HAD superfamily hydrolase (TIGR01509 family)
MEPPQRYDLVIFDCDGVLVDSELLSCRTLAECLRRQEIELDLEAVIDRFLGRSPQAIRDFFASINRVLPGDFFGELRLAVRAAFASHLRAVPDAAIVLGSLRSRYCVASSSDLERIEYALELTGLRSLIGERIFSAEMVERGKPAPDLFLHAAAGMQARPDRTLVIEDSASGIQAGKAAGMTVWGFAGGSHYTRRADGRRLLLAAGADRVFDRLTELGRQVSGEEDGSVGQ